MRQRSRKDQERPLISFAGRLVVKEILRPAEPQELCGSTQMMKVHIRNCSSIVPGSANPQIIHLCMECPQFCCCFFGQTVRRTASGE